MFVRFGLVSLLSVILLKQSSAFTIASTRQQQPLLQQTGKSYAFACLTETCGSQSRPGLCSRLHSTSGGGNDVGDDAKIRGIEDLLAKDESVARENMSPLSTNGPRFMSQGETLDPQALNPDFSDAKQTRVLIYIILSLLPVLFLIPFMLSREFIPQDMLPPVEM